MGKFEGIIKNPYGGTVLYGKEGTGVLTDAISIAEAVLKADGYYSGVKSCPDFHLIDLEEGSREIGIKQIEEIAVSQSCYPSYAKVNIFVINHADRMSAIVQNSLLKVLEDGSNRNLFLLCCENRLIPTIMNRCNIISAGHMITDEQIQICANSLGIPMWVVSLVSDGRYEWIKNLDFPKIAKMVAAFGQMKERREVLFIFDALPEKNDDSFIKNTNENASYALLRALSEVFTELVCIRAGKGTYLPNQLVAAFSDKTEGELIELNQLFFEACNKVKMCLLTHNDYFDAIRKMI